uniref:Uncharacterized protein n=1 Tax=Romanomermis culicivorax TaxID=13658 RepID=A0A915JMR8_ROMCU
MSARTPSRAQGSVTCMADSSTEEDRYLAGIEDSRKRFSWCKRKQSNSGGTYLLRTRASHMFLTEKVYKGRNGTQRFVPVQIDVHSHLSKSGMIKNDKSVP